MNDHETALRSSQGNLPHTPAPWYWDSDSVKGDPTGRVRYRVCALGKTITQVYYSSFEGGLTNAEADARLIAAAPELLEALQAAQERLNNAKLKGKGNDFYACIVAVEQDLRFALAKVAAKQ